MDVAGIFNAMESHALAVGVFDRVNTHEPKSAPGRGLTCALWVQRLRMISSGLTSASVGLDFLVRIYTSMLADPQDAIDPEVLVALDTLGAAYVGDFTLGGLVRAVDVRGIEGVSLGAQAGYLKQDQTQFRVMDMTVPLLVNDVWSEQP
jgi:hypothetical protein